MKYDFIYNDEHDYLVLKCSGIFDARDYKKALTELLRHSKWHQDVKLMLDNSDVTKEKIDFWEICVVSMYHDDIRKHIGHSKAAVVATSYTTYHISKRWLQFNQDKLQREVFLFDNLDDAEKWLITN